MRRLNTPEIRQRLNATLATPDEALVLDEVAPDPTAFSYDRGSGIEVCLAPMVEHGRVALLLSADLAYRGGDAELGRLFAGAALPNGWRPVATLRIGDPSRTLAYVEGLLGLDGKGARVPPASTETREVVVESRPAAPPMAGTPGERFGENLVELARDGRIAEVVGRDREVDAVIRVTTKLTKNGACLVGPAGVGKTAVVEKLARRVADGAVPPALADARILSVNLGLLAAGASYRNEFEGRFKEVLDAARDNQSVVLFLDELHVLCSNTNDVSQMVKADLGRGRIRVIGATTCREWRMIEEDGALARRFQVVPVVEPTREETLAILRGVRGRIEMHHGVTVDNATLSEVIELAVRYLPERHLPDKAIDLLDEAAAYESMAEPRAAGISGAAPKVAGQRAGNAAAKAAQNAGGGER